MSTKIIRIPRRFWDDHIDRELPAPPEVRETTRYVWVNTMHPDFQEVVKDAEHYVACRGPDGMDPVWVAHARAFLKAVERQKP